jgi:hypothetical protein
MIDEETETSLARLETPRPSPQTDAGMAALAAMSEPEFEIRLAGLKRARERMKRIHRELLQEETDYGVIPGTGKPTLLKAGAEKLVVFYGFAADFDETITYGEHEASPPITVVSKCRLHLGDLSGPVVATGCGAANSHERRYRWRRGERHCPACGLVGAIIRGKEELGGGWICWNKKGGCGAKFAANDLTIVEQQVGDVENPDPYDLLNTLVKMASKRSFVDAALRATATSGTFTQDLEEMAPPEARQTAQNAGTARPAPGPAQSKGAAPKAALKPAEKPKPEDDEEPITAKQRAGLVELALERGEPGRNWLPAIEKAKTRGEGRVLLDGLRGLPVVKEPEAEQEAALEDELDERINTEE